MNISSVNINRALQAYNKQPEVIPPKLPSLKAEMYTNDDKSSSFQDAIMSIIQDRVNNVQEAERMTKVAIAKPNIINVETVVHQVAKAEDSIKELTTVLSTMISAYQRIINMQI